MGCHRNVTHNTFPRQGRYLGQAMKVMFHYHGPMFDGVVVRDDAEEPFLTIIKLADGRHIMSTECQYQPA